ncbi:MAG: hypothetical protein IKL37_00325 [Alphaproteobacteria bacterium]|nr:hypothetical protein [Alphaproteobacteria bacterium]
MEQKITINCVIGVDPGSNGGIAVFIPGQHTKALKMPKDITELRDFFAYYRENYKPVVFLEKLSVRPDDVVVQGDRAAMGKLYRVQKMMANFEHLKALIETAGIPYVLVHPGKWTAYLGLRLVRKNGPKETKQERKNRYKKFAQKNYPGINVTLWNADALNILHFGRWALVNEPKWVKANLPEREYQKLF